MIEWLEEDESTETRAGETEGGLLTWLGRAVETPSDDGSFEFVASNSNEDRMGDSIDVQTWKLLAYKANPVILWGHNHSQVVGMSEKTGKTVNEAGQKELRVKIRFDEDPKNPLGMLVAHQVRNRFVRAVSVGFIPGEAISRVDLPVDDPLFVDGRTTSRWMAGYVYRHCELLETSVVSVPAHREALRLAAERVGREEAAIKAIRETVSKETAMCVVEAFKSNPEVRRAVLGLVFAERGQPAPKNGALDHLFGS